MATASLHEDGATLFVSTVCFRFSVVLKVGPHSWDEEMQLHLWHRMAMHCSQPPLPSKLFITKTDQHFVQKRQRTSQQLCGCGDLVSMGFSSLPSISFGLCLDQGRSHWLSSRYLYYIQPESLGPTSAGLLKPVSLLKPVTKLQLNWVVDMNTLVFLYSREYHFIPTQKRY